ncbi:MAG: hypothetical protein AMXMBFR74_22600 [Parvibaculum sp.]
MTRQSHGKAETVLTYADTGMQYHPVADMRMADRRIRANEAVLANRAALGDGSIRANYGFPTDFRTCANDGARLHGNALSQFRGRVHSRRGVHETPLAKSISARNFLRIKQLCCKSVGPVGLLRNQQRDPFGRSFGETGMNDACAGTGSFESASIFWIIQKTEIARTGGIERSHAVERGSLVRARSKARSHATGDFAQR